MQIYQHHSFKPTTSRTIANFSRNHPNLIWPTFVSVRCMNFSIIISNCNLTSYARSAPYSGIMTDMFGALNLIWSILLISDVIHSCCCCCCWAFFSQNVSAAYSSKLIAKWPQKNSEKNESWTVISIDDEWAMELYFYLFHHFVFIESRFLMQAQNYQMFAWLKKVWNIFFLLCINLVAFQCCIVRSWSVDCISFILKIRF